jgi:hypothetical protein
MDHLLNHTLEISFLVGFTIHLGIKTVLYPTTHNINHIIASTIILLRVIGGYFSALHSFVLIIGFLTSLAIFRLFLSPITSFRGPFLARLSKLWQLRNVTAGDNHRRIRALFEQYDEDWVRIGPNELVCRDPEAIKEIYLEPSKLQILYLSFNYHRVDHDHDLQDPWEKGMNASVFFTYVCVPEFGQ